MQQELFKIQARQIMDFSAAYDVYDSTQNVKVGAVKRKGFSPMVQDKRIIMDALDQEVGSVSEDSLAMALVRRLAANLIPQAFTVEIAGKPVLQLKQRFNPFVQKIDIDFSSDQESILDRRLGIAIAVLLCSIDGRQQ